MSAEHGCFLRAPGAKQWISLTDDLDMDWKRDVLQIFRCESSADFERADLADRFRGRLRGSHARCFRGEEAEQCHFSLP